MWITVRVGVVKLYSTLYHMTVVDLIPVSQMPIGILNIRGSIEHLECVEGKEDCKWHNTFLLISWEGVWCAGEG